MIFKTVPDDNVYVSRYDPENILASYSRHGFELDGSEWPSVEHYYQAMKFEDEAIREEIRQLAHPNDTVKLVKKYKRKIRKDWKKIKITVVTRGLYIKCRTHEAVASALLKTGDRKIVERSQYDYYWGCGRDGRGDNNYGKVLMNIRNRLANSD